MYSANTSQSLLALTIIRHLSDALRRSRSLLARRRGANCMVECAAWASLYSITRIDRRVEGGLLVLPPFANAHDWAHEA